MASHENNTVEMCFIHAFLKLENNVANYLTALVSLSLKTEGVMAKFACV